MTPRSCGPRTQVPRYPAGLADAWPYPHTDFGEGRDQPSGSVLRAAVPVSVAGSPIIFSGIIDTGGPLTDVSTDVMEIADTKPEPGPPVRLNLGGRTYRTATFRLSLQLHSISAGSSPATPRTWLSTVTVLDPWPHKGTAVILGKTGFLESFTVTFGPSAFAVEDAEAFERRFP